MPVIDLHLYALAIGVIAYIYSVELTQPFMIFGDLKGWLEKKLPRWLFYPVIACEKCVSAWIAIFWYIYKTWQTGFYFPELIYFISITILLTIIIKRILWRN
jgi:hypothetical protein